ncbi:hypothetical protein [Staphylothermus hellenicus]|uniref:Uncharacterized protein n=1 Tax=Staphylothermus hellenicus (strain DSM 12710 / JCM 10830 / BK20S6-10-b1 / P8) TaxID=591019 RepID=D7D9K3_STAHD|nr:hypothetical protein [Staphylothermus hellenicus]ADI32449.1 hypothetical protein Shell_1358 [Staphylothermus hellenicus DSM 12710]
MPIISSTKVFDSSLKIEDIINLLSDIEALIKSIKDARIVEKTPKGYVVEFIFRSFFRTISEKLIINSRRTSERSVVITAVGETLDIDVSIRLAERFPYTRIEIVTTCRSDIEKLCKKFVKFIEDSIVAYVRTMRKIGVRKEALKETVPMEEEKPPKPAVAEMGVERVEESRPSTYITQEIIAKLTDPIYLANTLLKATLIKRIITQVPSNIEEFRKTIVEPILEQAKNYKLVLISMRADNTEIYVSLTPDGKIIAVYGVIKRVREIKGGEEMLPVLLGVAKDREARIRIWGVTELS